MPSSARAEGYGGADLRAGFEAIERAAVDLFGAEVAAGWIRSAVEGRCAWAPDDDFAVAGPFAPPPEHVADRRSRYRDPTPTRGEHR